MNKEEKKLYDKKYREKNQAKISLKRFNQRRKKLKKSLPVRGYVKIYTEGGWFSYEAASVPQGLRKGDRVMVNKGVKKTKQGYEPVKVSAEFSYYDHMGKYPL